MTRYRVTTTYIVNDEKADYDIENEYEKVTTPLYIKVKPVKQKHAKEAKTTWQKHGKQTTTTLTS